MTKEEAFKKYRSLGSAVKASDLEATKYFLDFLSEKGQLPKDDNEQKPMSKLLWGAAGTSTPEIMALLIEYGADPEFAMRVSINETSTFLASVVENAVNEGKVDNVLALVQKHGIDVNFTNPEDEENLVTQAILQHRFDVAEALIAAGANWEAQTLRGNTVFHIACSMPVNMRAIRWLVEKNFDASIENDQKAVAAQCLPQIDGPDAQLLDWLFDELENYRAAQENKGSYEFPDDLFKEITGKSYFATEDETEIKPPAPKV